MHAAVAVGVAAVLGLLSALHLLWAAGSSWPARDRKSLGLLVVGVSSREGMPSRAPTVAVALGLALGAGVVLVGTGVIPTAAQRPAALASWGLVLLFAARGIGGFFDRALRPVIRSTPYAYWNERLYSPLCLSLAILLAWALSP